MSLFEERQYDKGEFEDEREKASDPDPAPSFW